MKDISEIITDLKKIHDPRKDKEVIVNIIKDTSGVFINQKDIDFVGDFLKLNIKGVEKNTIFMYQNKILILIKEKIKDRIIKRIV